MTSPHQLSATERLTLDNIDFDVDADGVATASLRTGSKMNTLTPAVASDLVAVIARCHRPDIRALVIASAKPDNFLAGADIEWLRSLDDADVAVSFVSKGHRILADLEDLSTGGTPVVAAIHGVCLGGGLELALACGARIASDDETATRLGLPEVKLGLLPGTGGTQRLPRLVGVAAALDLMLTGRSVRPRSALAMGLVDEVVPHRLLVETARRRALELAAPSPVTTSALDRVRNAASVGDLRRWALEGSRPGRRMLFSQATKRTKARTHGNYPAPEAIIDVVRTGVERGPEAGYAAERKAFGRLLVSPEAQALLGLYTATQELKKDPGSSETARQVRKVGVLGGGLMGGGIASVTVAEAGLRVRIKEVDDSGVQRALSHVRRHLDERHSKRRTPQGERQRAIQLVTATTELDGFDDADIVIEAVFEDLALKRWMLDQIEYAAGDHTIFASNTSSIPIGSIAEGARRPEQVIGMHYFSPVEKMPLLEVVVTEATADWVTATCVALGKAQGKTVIVVKDGPGFYTTRVLAPFANEVGHLIAEGCAVDDLDRVMVAWGFPVGPATLIDEVGIDVGAKIAGILSDAFGTRMAAPANFALMLADDRKGRKNGRGFYRYEEGVRKGVDESVYELLGGSGTERLPRRTLQDRLTTLFVNEAARCLEEGVIASPRDGDIGAVLGLGFPPFRGGPFAYADTVGAADIVSRLDNFANVHGERYAAADILRHHAASGRRFRD